MSTVTASVPAKLNLHLGVGPVRADGYHELVTVFQAVSLTDVVTVRPADSLTVTTTGEGAGSLPTDRSNLAARAAVVMARLLGRTDYDDPAGPGVSIAVAKRIPVAAGLAGGSGDAAATLVACNSLWEGGLSRDDLVELAADIGSDVPFSVLGGTALGRGRGELLSPVLARGRFHWVLAFAHRGQPTPAVYRRLDLMRADGKAPVSCGSADDVLSALVTGTPQDLAAVIANDLQAAAVALVPRLSDTLRAGRELGALAGIVSGSGPTVAFLAADEPAAHQLAADLSGAGVCRTVRVTSGPVPGARLQPGPG